jgi:arylsulfatase/uncharacterized sulfatase
MVTDIVPTLSELVGVTELDNSNDITITGRSLLPVIRNQSSFTYGPDEAVGLEVAGNSALFKGRYKLSRNMPPHGDGVWRLYDIQQDPGETRDLAADKAELLAQLMDDYRDYARDYGVQEMPEGYDSVKQIFINTAGVYIDAYGRVMLAAGILLLLALAWLIWRIRRNS